ncbi:hypothetical protein [Flavobacterium sp. MK4S-17]|uniref:hypothetical protein n=1 Tax=Flavobacterium sp. MK4S-17 TaxID=2543737 RepID=UPI00135C5493|nr:hypothetical protein [Flavobacterium sp. MK4S-17]
MARELIINMYWLKIPLKRKPALKINIEELNPNLSWIFTSPGITGYCSAHCMAFI